MRTEARSALAVTSPQVLTANAIGPQPSTLAVSATPLPINRYAVYGCLAIFGLAWDLYSKHVVFSWFGCPGRAQWTWRAGDFIEFTLHTNFNEGALWGFGQGGAPVFAGLSVLAVIGIIYFLFFAGYARSAWLTFALGLVTAGALGNLFDRLGMHGWMHDGKPVYAVRDFLYFKFFGTFDWAIFNFADTYLVVGAIMLVIQSFQADAHERAAATVAESASPPTA